GDLLESNAMASINAHYLKLRSSYLFSEIARRVREFQDAHPDAKLIRLGIGDVTRPLAPAVITAMHAAVDEMARAESFKGYGPETGYEFLLELIARHDYGERGVKVMSDEIFVGDGGKSDSANIQEIFAADCVVAVIDPIYEVEGARDVAIEFRSFSKTAGFTGTRCAFTVVPKDLMGRDAAGKRVSLNSLWFRRQSTKFNGVPYVIQRAAAAVYTDAGRREVRSAIDFYMENARIIRQGLEAAGLMVYGGENAPYIWVKTPPGLGSWDFFDKLLGQALELLGVEPHAEREAHLAENRLDLVERLLAEVLRLQQLGLGLLHEVGDGSDVGGLQAVRGADGELELVHVAEEVLVQLGPRPHLVTLGRRLLRRRLGEVREQLEVVLQDPRRLRDRRDWCDAAIGPHLDDEPLLAFGRGLDVEVHALDRRE